LNKLSLIKKYFNAFSSKSNFKSIISNLRWLFFDKVLQIVLGFAIISLTARSLGVQKYGIYSYVVAFVGIFQPLSSLGLNTIVIRELVNNPDDKHKILGTTFILQLAGGILSLCLGLFFISLLRPHESFVFQLVFILSISNIINSFQCIDVWFQSQLQSRYTVVSNNVAYITYFLLTNILLAIDKLALFFAILLRTFNSIVKAFVLISFYHRLEKSFNLWSLNPNQSLSLLKESSPLILSAFAISIYVKIDQVMLGQMANDSAVAIYSAATQISEAFYFIPVIILSSVSPAIYKAKKELTEKEFYERIKLLLIVLAVLSIVISISISLLSSSLILLLFGKAFADSGLILTIHIWASIFVFSGTGASCWFVAEQLTHLTFFRTLLGAVINVLLNFYLIPKYAGVGAAIATVISYAVASVFANYFHPKTRRLFWLQLGCLTGIFITNTDRSSNC
jgi:PST family polysaccharide transporter